MPSGDVHLSLDKLKVKNENKSFNETYIWVKGDGNTISTGNLVGKAHGFTRQWQPLLARIA